MSDRSESALVAVRGAEALSRRDLDAMLEVAHPDIEFHTHPGFVGEEPVYRGHEGVRRWLEALAPWGSFEVEVEEVIDVSEEVVVTATRVQARGAGSGADVELRTHDVIEVTDGRIRRRRTFESREDALAAARSEARRHE